MRPNWMPPSGTDVIGTSSNTCAMLPCVWPATIACSVPRGRPRTTSKISLRGSHEDRSRGLEVSSQRPPAWATSTTMSAPCRRRLSASDAIVSTSGAVASEPTLATSVCLRPV